MYALRTRIQGIFGLMATGYTTAEPMYGEKDIGQLQRQDTNGFQVIGKMVREDSNGYQDTGKDNYQRTVILIWVVRPLSSVQLIL